MGPGGSLGAAGLPRGVPLEAVILLGVSLIESLRYEGPPRPWGILLGLPMQGSCSKGIPLAPLGGPPASPTRGPEGICEWASPGLGGSPWGLYQGMFLRDPPGGSAQRGSNSIRGFSWTRAAWGIPLQVSMKGSPSLRGPPGDTPARLYEGSPLPWRIPWGSLCGAPLEGPPQESGIAPAASVTGAPWRLGSWAILLGPRVPMSRRHSLDLAALPLPGMSP